MKIADYRGINFELSFSTQRVDDARVTRHGINFPHTLYSFSLLSPVNGSSLSHNKPERCAPNQPITLDYMLSVTSTDEIKPEISVDKPNVGGV